MIDALYLAGEKAVSRNPPAALVVITDGDDRSSFYKKEQLFSKLRQHKVRVFCVGLINLLGKREKKRAAELLSKVAEASGGRAFFLESPAEIPGITSAIMTLIREPQQP